MSRVTIALRDKRAVAAAVVDAIVELRADTHPTSATTSEH